VRKILAGIARSGERYGRHRIAAMLLGNAEEVPPSLAALSIFGVLRGESSETLGDWIRAAVSAGLVAVSNDQYRTLALTERGREFAHGRVRDAAIRRPPRLPRSLPYALMAYPPRRGRPFRSDW